MDYKILGTAIAFFGVWVLWALVKSIYVYFTSGRYKRRSQANQQEPPI